MSISKFVWEQLRLANRLPGAYRLYLWLGDLLLRDGSTNKIPFGPLHGHRLKRYRCHQAWMALGLYEPHVTKFILNTLSPGDVFYDIGANAGYFTLAGAKAVGPSGQVVAFEPVSFNAAAINEQIHLNAMENYCRVEALAVANHTGTGVLAIPERNANSHLEQPGTTYVSQTNAQKVQVRTIALDDYHQNASHPKLIKMDIEGAEVAALEGAGKMLCHANAPIMMVSVHSAELNTRVEEILRDAHYQIVHLKGFTQMILARPVR